MTPHTTYRHLMSGWPVRSDSSVGNQQMRHPEPTALRKSLFLRCCRLQVQRWGPSVAGTSCCGSPRSGSERYTFSALLWGHNGRDGVSNHQPHDCLLICLFRRRPKKTSKPRVTGICAGNSPVTGEFPALMASNAENVSMMTSSWYELFLHYSMKSPVLGCGSNSQSRRQCFWPYTSCRLSTGHGLTAVTHHLRGFSGDVLVW